MAQTKNHGQAHESAPNPFLLAADNSTALLPLLREKPSLASDQDQHGYSLLHAAASYNHLDLLRTLIDEFHVDVNLQDEDGETALFVTETPEAAKILIEDFAADVTHRNSEGLTAREKIEAEGDFPAVAAYLATINPGPQPDQVQGEKVTAVPAPVGIGSLPAGMTFTVGTIDQTDDSLDQVDPEFRRRIEQLAQRDDFNSPSGQADLRRLVEDAIVDQGLGDGDGRNVRPKQS